MLLHMLVTAVLTEGSVPALYHAVCFGMVGWHGLVLNVEDLTMLLPKCRCELYGSVGDYLVRNSKKSNPN